MQFKHSLRSRIIVAFSIFSGVLALIYGLAVYTSLHAVEDQVLNRSLQLEIDHFLDEYPQSRTILTNRFLKSYIGYDSLPVSFQELLRNKSDGIHELEHTDYEYHVGIQQLPDSVERLYLIYNVQELELLDKTRGTLLLILLSTGFVVIGIGVWLGFATSRRVISPVTKLAELVEHSNPEKTAINFTDAFYDDEVGALASALEHSMHRVQAFIERERQFTRDASHELRTPVAVIKGAAEVMELSQQAENEKIRKPLDRIIRAVTDMENNIQAFLWLAREQGADSNTPGMKCKLGPIINEVVEKNRHLIIDKPVSVDISITKDITVEAPAAVVSIVVNNLIQNAFHYTQRGEVLVNVSDNQLTIKDSGIGIAASDLPHIDRPNVKSAISQGFGYGLAIVKSLCERFDWQLKFESKEGSGTAAFLIFNGPGLP